MGRFSTTGILADTGRHSRVFSNIGQQQRNLSGVSGDCLKEYPRNRPVSRWMASLCRADDIPDRVTKDRFGMFIE